VQLCSLRFCGAAGLGAENTAAVGGGAGHEVHGSNHDAAVAACSAAVEAQAASEGSLAFWLSLRVYNPVRHRPPNPRPLARRAHD
jgi:hypothetical protein